MPVPNITDQCLLCAPPTQALTVTLPGGAEMVVNVLSTVPPTGADVAKAMIGQINTALAPLQMPFNIIDAVISVFNCVKAVPEAITELDVAGLLQCAPDMFEKIQKLLNLVPQLSIPVLVRDVLTVIIALLEGLVAELENAKRQLDNIARSALKAMEPGNGKLGVIVACAQSTYESYMVNVQQGMAPLNRLMGLLNLFLAMVPGVDPLPCLGSIDGLPTVVQDALQTFINILKIVRNLLPGGLKLNPYIPKGSNC